MLTKIFQKFVIDFLKVCPIGDIKPAQQVFWGFFNRILLRGYQPALQSAENIRRVVFYTGMRPSLDCLTRQKLVPTLW